MKNGLYQLGELIIVGTLLYGGFKGANYIRSVVSEFKNSKELERLLEDIDYTNMGDYVTFAEDNRKFFDERAMRIQELQKRVLHEERIRSK